MFQCALEGMLSLFTPNPNISPSFLFAAELRHRSVLVTHLPKHLRSDRRLSLVFGTLRLKGEPAVASIPS
jgi:hypothetical protein